MKTIEVTDEEYEMIISGVANEIAHLERLKKRRINNSLRVHIEARIPKVRAFLTKLQSQK